MVPPMGLELGLTIGGSGGAPGPLTGGFSFANGYQIDTVAGIAYDHASAVYALTAAWKTGNLFRVNIAGVTTIIKGVGPGYPDVATLAGVLGVDARTGVGGAPVDILYDQSGNGRDWFQTDNSVGRMPMVWLIRGKVWLHFDGGLNVGIGHAYMAAAIPVNNQSVTMFATVIPFTSTSILNVGQVSAACILLAGTSPSGATDMGFFGPSSNTGAGQSSTPYLGFGDFTTGLQQSIKPGAGIQPQVIGFSGGDFGTAMMQNSNLVQAAVPLAVGAHTTAHLGLDWNDIFPMGARLTSIVVSPTLIGIPQANGYAAAAAAANGINLNVTSTNPVNICIDGASTDIGQGSVPGDANYQVNSGGGYGYCEQLKDIYADLGKQISWHNFAVPGAGIADRTPDYVSSFVQGTGFQPGSTKNILIAPGVCSLATLEKNGGNAASAYADFTTWLTAAKSVAWTKIACILFPDASFTGMPAYNALMLANAASNGIDIIDGRTALSALANPGYTQADGHPTVLGSSLYATMLRQYLDPLI
jgi:hypothetical protein